MTGAVRLEGVFHILATPFDDDERIDDAGLASLVEWVLERGVHGLTILGIAGEVYRLTDEERGRVTRAVLDRVRGRVPVVVGAGHPGATLATIEYVRKAEQAGAAAVMIAPPFLARPTPEQIVSFYEALSRSTSVPIVIQDEPVTTGLQLAVGTFARIVEAAPMCQYAKIEHVPTAPKVRQLSAAIGDPRLGLFGGSGGLYFVDELRQGSRGIMTGFAFPEALLDVWHRYRNGDEDGAFNVFSRWLPLLRLEGLPGAGLAIRKEMLRRRGAIASARLRSPAPELDASLREEVDRMLDHVREARLLEAVAPLVGS